VVDVTELHCDPCHGRMLACVRLLLGKRASCLCPHCHSVTTVERSPGGAVLIATKPARTTAEAVRQ
jgi:hypothetical protein